MGLQKNVAGQSVAVFAWDTDADAPKTGDAANITAQVSKDFGSSAATNDTNPTELDATHHPGIYLFALTQAESNADVVLLSPVSSTDGVVLEPVQVFTQLPSVPLAVTTGAVQTDGGNSATQIKTDLAATDDGFYRDAYCLITSGDLAGQVRLITGYNGTSKALTVKAFTDTPADDVTFAIINR